MPFPEEQKPSPSVEAPEPNVAAVSHSTAELPSGPPCGIETVQYMVSKKDSCMMMDLRISILCIM